MKLDEEVGSMHIIRDPYWQGPSHILPQLILHRIGFSSDQIIRGVLLSLGSLACVTSSGV